MLYQHQYRHSERPKCWTCNDGSAEVRLVPVTLLGSRWTLLCEDCFQHLRLHDTIFQCACCENAWIIRSRSETVSVPHSLLPSRRKRCYDCQFQVNRNVQKKTRQDDPVAKHQRDKDSKSRKIRLRKRDRAENPPVTPSRPIPCWVRYLSMRAYRDGGTLVWKYQISEAGAPPGVLRHDENVSGWSETDIYELTMRMFDLTGRDLKFAGYKLVEGFLPL